MENEGGDNMTFEITDSNSENQDEKIEIKIYNSHIDKSIDIPHLSNMKMKKNIKDINNDSFPIIAKITTEITITKSFSVPESSATTVDKLHNVIFGINQNNIDNNIRNLLPSGHSAMHLNLMTKFCEVAQNFYSELKEENELAIKKWLIDNQPKQPEQNITSKFDYHGNIFSLDKDKVSGHCIVKY